MVNIVWFKDSSRKDINLVGGKAANLGEMLNNKFPIPSGFTVSSEAYINFIKQNNLAGQISNMLNSLNEEDSQKLNEVSERIRNLILNAEISGDIKRDIIHAYENLNVDTNVLLASRQAAQLIQSGREHPFVAVRSSATAEDLPSASFAGLQDTYLNVRGSNNVVEAVKRCWASLFTSRAIYYRVKNKFEHDKVAIAVVVQKMINSDRAGVMFTADPSTNDKNKIVIEAAYGLGDAVVSGSISPDQFILDKDSLDIVSRKISEKKWMNTRDPNTGRSTRKDVIPEKINQPALNDSEIKNLASVAKRIEEYYGAAQDIEYAIQDGRTYIVQSRAITTLDKKEEVHEREQIEGDEILSGIAASPGVGVGVVKIVRNSEDLNSIKEGDILVAKMTNPDYVQAMQKAKAIVTDEGGSTSHAAIVSRELGIPAIVGTNKATEVLHDGQEISVDGGAGKVYSGKIEMSWEPEEEEVKTDVETITEIKVIMDLPQLAEKAAKTGADGVGLLRAEHMILASKEHPYNAIKQGRKEQVVEQFYNHLMKFAEAFGDKPIWYRTLDAPTDEFKNLPGGENEPDEANPMLGYRAIRRDLKEVEVLKAQLEAVKRAREKGANIGVMIPLVTEIEQVRKVKELIREFNLEDMDFGIMVETPAAVQLIEEFCQEGINFASIGSNDLTQFTLAIDRNNGEIQDMYNELHPGVLRQIDKVIRACRKYKVKSSICGQAGSKEEMAKHLVKIGIDSISVNIDAVNKVRKLVYNEERKLILETAREKYYKD